MYCHVLLMRLDGGRSHEPRSLSGRLSSLPSGASVSVDLTPVLTMRPVASLHDARLVAFREDALLLRGYEDAGQRGVLQEWLCKPVDTRYGFDAAGRPLSSTPFGDSC